MQAEVLYLDDEPGDASAGEVARAVKLHARAHRCSLERRRKERPEAKQLSFRVSGSAASGSAISSRRCLP